MVRLAPKIEKRGINGTCVHRGGRDQDAGYLQLRGYSIAAAAGAILARARRYWDLQYSAQSVRPLRGFSRNHWISTKYRKGGIESAELFYIVLAALGFCDLGVFLGLDGGRGEIGPLFIRGRLEGWILGICGCWWGIIVVGLYSRRTQETMCISRGWRISSSISNVYISGSSPVYLEVFIDRVLADWAANGLSCTYWIIC